MSTASPFVRALLGAALAVLLGLGGSLLLARFGRHRLMRWPAAVVITLAIAAAVALGVPPATLTVGVDTVQVCFSKGLGAPVGSAVAGSAEFVAEARRLRKMLGGGVRQGGILAAAALVGFASFATTKADLSFAPFAAATAKFGTGDGRSPFAIAMASATVTANRR